MDITIDLSISISLFYHTFLSKFLVYYENLSLNFNLHQHVEIILLYKL